MIISICNKCKAINYLSVLKKVKEIYPDAKYEIGCNNMCGIGRSKVVIILNNKPIIADTEEELINKIKQVKY
jgi:uncharacterized protein YuzB (UPF0349 family)